MSDKPWAAPGLDDQRRAEIAFNAMMSYPLDMTHPDRGRGTEMLTILREALEAARKDQWRDDLAARDPKD